MDLSKTAPQNTGLTSEGSNGARGYIQYNNITHMNGMSYIMAGQPTPPLTYPPQE